MTELPTVLAAVDASPSAQAVLSLAQTLASIDAGGRLFVTQAVAPLPAAWEEVLWPMASLGNDRPAIVAEVAENAARIVRGHLKDARLTLPPEAVRVVVGPVADAILGAAGQVGPQTIVVGRWGESGPAAGLLGSVAARVLRRAPCAVAVTDAGVEPRPIERIGLAVADGPAARASFEAALSLAARIGARVTPLVVLEPSVKNARNEARALLTRLIEGQPLPFSVGGQLQALLDKPRLLEGEAASELIACASEFDLLVLGRARSRATHVGRVAEEVARRAGVPVLILPPGEAESA